MAVDSSATTDDPDPDRRSPPAPPPHPASDFLWKNLFAVESSTVTASSSPSFMEDGTPVVLAPPSVILKATEAWTGHILCHFLGSPPSPAKIFTDLNPVWGRKGAITVRRFSEGTCLVFVPSASHRRWILDAGLWSSGNVTFTVSEWSASSSLVSTKLTSAPTLLTLRDVPPQLWSQSGVETIAGGVGKLIPNVRASLPIASLGTAKIRAIVPLGPILPSAVIVRDTLGNTVRVAVEYGRLPVLCSSCKEFGHSSLRCPQRPTKTSDSAAPNDSNQPKQPSITGEATPEASHSSPPLILKDTSVQEEEKVTGSFSKNPNSPDGPLKPIYDQITLTTSTSPVQNQFDPGSITDPSHLNHLPSSDSPSPHLSHPHPSTYRSSPPSLDNTTVPTTDLESSPPPSTEVANQTTQIKAEINAALSTSRMPLDQAPSIANQEDVILPLMAQIKADLSSVFSTPRQAPPPNTHIYFSTPSTSSITNPISPPSVSFQDSIEEVLPSIPQPQHQDNTVQLNVFTGPDTVPQPNTESSPSQIEANPSNSNQISVANGVSGAEVTPPPPPANTISLHPSYQKLPPVLPPTANEPPHDHTPLEIKEKVEDNEIVVALSQKQVPKPEEVEDKLHTNSNPRDSFKSFYEEVIHSIPKSDIQISSFPKEEPKKMQKSNNSKNKKWTFSFDDDGEDIARILNSKEWQNRGKNGTSDKT